MKFELDEDEDDIHVYSFRVSDIYKTGYTPGKWPDQIIDYSNHQPASNSFIFYPSSDGKFLYLGNYSFQSMNHFMR
jgi:hypothetical protein